ncbi:hypothetical protein CB1_000613017 [Camelus ferus]|nr:hypothetical protein CB1_000613017 [Camelus ferus]
MFRRQQLGLQRFSGERAAALRVNEAMAGGWFVKSTPPPEQKRESCAVELWLIVVQFAQCCPENHQSGNGVWELSKQRATNELNKVTALLFEREGV